MTPSEFKTWRKARKLSQSKLADLLGWSRDMLYNREAARVDMPDDIDERMSKLAESFKPRSTTHLLLPHGSYRLTMALQPVTMAAAYELPPGDTYWKYAGVTPETGHMAYSLFRVSSQLSHNADRVGLPAHLCTFIQLDVEDWRAFEIAGDRSATAVAHINKWLDIERPRLATIIYQQPSQTP